MGFRILGQISPEINTERKEYERERRMAKLLVCGQENSAGSVHEQGQSGVDSPPSEGLLSLRGLEINMEPYEQGKGLLSVFRYPRHDRDRDESFSRLCGES